MPKFGMQYLVVAKRLQTEGVNAYSDGKVLALAISASFTPNTISTKYYAENAQQHTIEQFTGGTIKLTGSDIKPADQAMLHGHAYDETTKTLTKNKDDVPQPVGIGWIETIINDEKRYKQLARWFFEAQFPTGESSAETVGEKMTLQSPSLSGTFMPTTNGNWGMEIICDTYQEAVTWLNEKAKIVVSGKGD